MARMAAGDRSGINTRCADLDDQQVRALLAAHLDRTGDDSPATSDHALDIEGLRAEGVRLWAAWDGALLLGIGGWKILEPGHGEAKSFHTAEAARGRGVARSLLTRVIDDARRHGIARLSLETGSSGYYAAARALYARNGFAVCAPFPPYVADPHSVFMTRAI